MFQTEYNYSRTPLKLKKNKKIMIKFFQKVKKKIGDNQTISIRSFNVQLKIVLKITELSVY